MKKYNTKKHKFQINSTLLLRIFQSFPLKQKTAKSENRKSRQPLFEFAGQRIVCDECAAPLHLYGENFIESYINGRANVLRCLCDLHADELEVKK